jgi:hypothetical protein
MLRKEEILERTNNGLNVFKHYITCQWRVGRNFFNPLYEDKKASCNIYFDRKNGVYNLKDFGNDEYSGDCFYFVGKLKGLNCNNTIDFVEILKSINRDLSLGLSEDTEIPIQSIPKPTIHILPEKKTKPYSFQEQRFTQNELEYWEKYGINSELLEQYKVCSVREFKSENSDNKPYSIASSSAEPIFGYKSKRYIKLYRPSSKIRFLYGGDIGDNYCFGLEQLPAKGDTVFITGGEKDVLSLVAKGFHAICFNSETINIPATIIHKLSFRFKHIILLYDVDKTGLESSSKHKKQLAEYGVKRLLLPLSGTKEEKDISDYFRQEINSRESFMILFLVASLVAGSICLENVQIDTLGINVHQTTNKKAYKSLTCRLLSVYCLFLSRPFRGERGSTQSVYLSLLRLINPIYLSVFHVYKVNEIFLDILG